jgi:hypothetical protein
LQDLRTGATGLEPATSGVTARRSLTKKPCIRDFLGAIGHRQVTVSVSSGTQLWVMAVALTTQKCCRVARTSRVRRFVPGASQRTCAAAVTSSGRSAPGRAELVTLG